MTSAEKFPTTLVSAIRYFAEEAICRDFLARLRWPDGVRCVACDSDRIGFITSRSLWRCKVCRKEFSVKKGTIFEDSPIPLSKWLPAMWLYSAGKKGRSSHQLAKDLGVTQKTAWFIGHRIRLAMEVGGIEGPLSGEVEADETLIGGLEERKHKSERRANPWGPLSKTAVLGMLQRDGDVRAMMVPSRRKPVIQAEVRANVAPGSFLDYTDALKSYHGMDRDYVHQVIDHAVRDRIDTNGLENFWSILKRVLFGTHHSVAPVHLDRCLDENVLRFNTRRMADLTRFTLTASRTKAATVA